MEFILLLTCFLMFSGTTLVDGNGVAKITTKEDDNVIIPCSLGTTLTDKRIEWIKDNKEIYIVENGRVTIQDELFRDRVSHFPDELESGNASIKINKAKESDNGSYDCKYSDPGKVIPSALNKIELTVEMMLKDRSGDFNPEEASRGLAIASVSKVRPTDDGALLRCEVLKASPEPTVVWYDSAGNNVSNKAPQITDKGQTFYDVILETTVTKTDNYTCEATQEEKHHQSKKTTHVTVRGKGISVTPSLVLIGITIGVLTGV
ncbi:V-set domain-containing T-cell activation inhibitor 1 [Fundulus heteroclitus]|uniref:V-set domain-containing T-cell activation inhibitor 1 n=1 Tax=Fundulus heteroclitus TaxID=8078 RepID=UPI00165BE183|nr:V-set domain-containing T-cell activation inhibitor 1 [Fundulus heteroclitus]